MNPSSQRLRHWATRGALVLAAVAIFLGAIFTVVITMAEGALPTDAAGWSIMLVRTVLIWGGGGLFFGAILGMYASMIWRDPDV
ncbi:ABC transporter ATP-binding protein [Chloroflexales bacterium ZM16-3]|nr:ABC transporter ATP-binding protein [Chloroflexales bacterium ZM16-3]